MQPPLRQVFVHNRDESVIMMPLDEMHEFVDDDIFEALYWLFGEFKVQPDATGVSVACAPLGFHSFDAVRGYLKAQGRLPFVQKWRDQFPQLLAIPTLQDSLALRGIHFWPDMEFDGRFIAHQNFGCRIVAQDAETIALPQEIVALSADHLPFRLAGLGFKSRPLAFDPPKL